jgi:hypothetical protein
MIDEFPIKLVIHLRLPPLMSLEAREEGPWTGLKGEGFFDCPLSRLSLTR